MKKQKIIAQFDGSYALYKDNMYRVGIGYSINGETFSEQYIAGVEQRAGNVFAEVLALMGLLEKLQDYKNCHITIKGDNLHVIAFMKRNERSIRGFEIQFEYLRMLAKELRLAGNYVVFEWVPRAQNKQCDAVASKPEKFLFKYSKDGKIRQFQIHDYFYDLAKEVFEHWIESHSYQAVE